MDQFRAGSHTAVAVHDPSNMFYLTEGYTGEGVVYLSEHSRVIITDFRYTEQAERQAPGFRVEMISKGRGHSKVIALTLSAPDETQAEMMCSRWKDNSQDIYAYIMKKLLGGNN